MFWSLIRCKQVAYIILAAKLYEIVYEFDIRAIIKLILKKILESATLLILCIDSKSLYNYLVKLDITQEKQLIINVINLRQFYK